MPQQSIHEAQIAECKSPEDILNSHDTAHKKRMAKTPDFFTNQATTAFTKFKGLKDALAAYLKTPEKKRPTLWITPYEKEPSQPYRALLAPSNIPTFCPNDPVNNLCCHVLYELHNDGKWHGATGFLVAPNGKEVNPIKAPKGSSIYSDAFPFDAYTNAIQSEYKNYLDNLPPVKKRKSPLKVQQAWVNASLREQPAGIACILVSVLGCLGGLMVSAQITNTNTLMIGLFAASAALLIAGIVLLARACHANKKLKQRNPYWENYLNKKKELTELLPSQ